MQGSASRESVGAVMREPTASSESARATELQGSASPASKAAIPARAELANIDKKKASASCSVTMLSQSTGVSFMIAASSKYATAGGGMVVTQSSSSTQAIISFECVSASAQAPISTRASNSAAGVLLYVIFSTRFVLCSFC